MGTIFESRHVPLRVWLQVIHLICASKKGMSTQQIHRTIGGSMTTAWFLTHRVCECMTELGWPHAGKLGGEGETLEPKSGSSLIANPGGPGRFGRHEHRTA